MGDLYVATRTDQGWVTKYVGIPGTQTYEANGPPDELRSDYTAGTGLSWGRPYGYQYE